MKAYYVRSDNSSAVLFEFGVKFETDQDLFIVPGSAGVIGKTENCDVVLSVVSISRNKCYKHLEDAVIEYNNRVANALKIARKRVTQLENSFVLVTGELYE